MSPYRIWCHSVYRNLGAHVLRGASGIIVIRKYLPIYQPSLIQNHVRSAGSSLPIRTSTTGTCLPSASMQANLGRIPFELMMTTRYSHAEVVFLRLKANCVSSFIKSPSRLQSKNAMVFNRGEEGGSENKAENRCDTATSHSITSVSRAGRDDGENIMSLV